MACAVLIRRAILQNARLAQRRSLFEVLSIFAYVVAITLSVFSLLNWTGQPHFVLACSALWTLFSLSVVIRLWWINLASQSKKILDIPDVWDEPFIRKQAEKHAVEGSAAATADTAELHSVEPTEAVPQATGSNTAVHTDTVTGSMMIATASTESQVAGIQARGVGKATTRAARLQQYRRERLSRYRQTRSSRRTGGNNLAIYRRLTRNGTSDSN